LLLRSADQFSTRGHFWSLDLCSYHHL
jgi:hypothetical protein